MSLVPDSDFVPRSRVIRCVDGMQWQRMDWNKFTEINGGMFLGWGREQNHCCIFAGYNQVLIADLAADWAFNLKIWDSTHLHKQSGEGTYESSFHH